MASPVATIAAARERAADGRSARHASHVSRRRERAAAGVAPAAAGAAAAGVATAHAAACSVAADAAARRQALLSALYYMHLAWAQMREPLQGSSEERLRTGVRVVPSHCSSFGLAFGTQRWDGGHATL
eukprot:358063-Chlamydomonas_euryale.AAC.2